MRLVAKHQVITPGGAVLPGADFEIDAGEGSVLIARGAATLAPQPEPEPEPPKPEIPTPKRRR